MRKRTVCRLVALLLGVLTLGRSDATEFERAGDDFWSFRPLRRPLVPGHPADHRPLPDVTPLAPNADDVRDHLQAWYSADSLLEGAAPLVDGDDIVVWRDLSGHERHLFPTAEKGGTGSPPYFVPRGAVNGRPVVHFDEASGVASAAEKGLPVEGNGGYAMILVANLRPLAKSSSGVVVGFGDPGPSDDPGRPTSALLQIDRMRSRLVHAGGYGHDAGLGNGSFGAVQDRPAMITIVKRPGPMKEGTSITLNGLSSPSESSKGPPRWRVGGTNAIPDLRKRPDFGILLGRCIRQLSGFRGDIAELIIYNSALSPSQRAAVEAGLIRKYGITVPAAGLDATANPIDTFIEAKLREKGLRWAPRADRRTLIRRLSVDLLGLPPSPERVETFVNDRSEDAWEKLIDELLGSKHYGERWGKHWLDVARYGDTGGYQTDLYFKNAWRYRDYVVKSFNDDKPYDRFVQEQIAGDELWPNNLKLDGSYVMAAKKLRNLEARIGTGFYALGPEIHESSMDAQKLRYEQLTDWVDTTGAAFLGLSFGCARCHDHKFDPISQQDYFAMHAVFASSRTVRIPLINPMELADQRQHYPAVLRVVETRKRYRMFAAKVKGRELTPAEKERRKQLLEQIGQAVIGLQERAPSTPNSRFDGLMEVPTATVLGPLRPELVRPVHLLDRGEIGQPRQVATAALPAVLAEATGVVGRSPDSSRSRKELARWLTRADHPLTARVMANRIWQWHFGRGIVSTPNDFGGLGHPPSHPELLDWLATEFVARGWSVKAMHRLILMSEAYQRSSGFHSPEHERVDPENTLLWRAHRRRLEAEALWDAIHSVAGTINLKMGGRSVMPPLTHEEVTSQSVWIVNADPAEYSRRGMYIFMRRNFTFPMFEVFDAPINAVSCPVRNDSTVATQALWGLNNRTSVGQATKFAARLVKEAGDEPERWVERSFQLALCRAPDADEKKDAIEFLDALTKEHEGEAPLESLPPGIGDLPKEKASALAKFCLTLFNLNEFLYID